MTTPAMSEYDWMELVSFDFRIEEGGFDSAYLSYPPTFEDPGLQTIAADERLLHRAVLGLQVELERWREVHFGDAAVLIDAHRRQAAQRREAGNVA
ncbi:hypothetical protein [Frankia sp. R82]|uniref:hypothetical protein n=1 Tax=Frankia sp. R82 TaxID=2950553 RepID=UPI0020448F0E|nr:hypothetical protein [Frankia sp. R82]MCM3884143.1 hypothetical protein [Frankia sp. R82]